MSIFDFTLISLACWRVTSLLVQEDGPGDAFAKLRRILGVRYDERSVPYGTNIVAKAFLCVWCLSIWVALALVPLLKPANIPKYIITALAVSAVAIVVDRIASSTH